MQKNASQMDTWQAAGRTCKILISPEATGTKGISALLVELSPEKAPRSIPTTGSS